MNKLVWILMALLVLLRNDFWFWPESFLVLDFVPISLAHQIVISLAAALLWYLATVYCWPAHLEEDLAQEQDEAKA